MTLSDEMKCAITRSVMEILYANRTYACNSQETLEEALTNLVETILKESSLGVTGTPPPTETIYLDCDICGEPIKEEITQNCSRINCPHKTLYND